MKPSIRTQMVKKILVIFNNFPGRKHIYYITLNKELQGVLAFRTAGCCKSLLFKKSKLNVIKRKFSFVCFKIMTGK